MHPLDFLEPYASAPCAALCKPRKKELEAISRRYFTPRSPFSLRLALKGKTDLTLLPGARCLRCSPARGCGGWERTPGGVGTQPRAH